MARVEVVVAPDDGVDVTLVDFPVEVETGFAPNGPFFGIPLYVQGSDPGMTYPGLWVQTGLGPDGSDYTFWIEDGF